MVTKPACKICKEEIPNDLTFQDIIKKNKDDIPKVIAVLGEISMSLRGHRCHGGVCLNRQNGICIIGAVRRHTNMLVRGLSG